MLRRLVLVVLTVFSVTPSWGDGSGIACFKFFTEKGTISFKVHNVEYEIPMPLTKTEQVDLAILYSQTGNPKYRDTVIESYYPLFTKIVANATRVSMENREELFQAVVLKALESFEIYAKYAQRNRDKGEDAKFGSYLKLTLQGVVAHTLMQSNSALSIPRNSDYTTVYKFYKQGKTVDDVVLHFEEKSIGKRQKDVFSREVIQAAYDYFGSREINVDNEVRSKEESDGLSILESSEVGAEISNSVGSVPRPETVVSGLSSKQNIENTLELYIQQYGRNSQRTPEANIRNKKILRRIFDEFIFSEGSELQKGDRLKVIASDFGITRERVRQIRDSAYKELASPQSVWRHMLFPHLRQSNERQFRHNQDRIDAYTGG